MQEEKISVWEAKFKYEKWLLSIPGVKRISIAGVGEKFHIVVSVNCSATGEKIIKITGGNLDGWPIHISLRRTKTGGNKSKEKTPTKLCTHCPVHCAQKESGRKTVVKPRRVPREELEDHCDIARKLLGKKPRKGAKGSTVCRQMVGWTTNRNKMKWVKENGLPHWIPKEMGNQMDGKGNPTQLAYTYIQHRRACPMYQNTVLPNIDRLTPINPGK
jgi:hypothetical protein